MVSRKRNKGKERKAKKEDTEKNRVHNNWTSWARGVDAENKRKIVHCDHGCGAAIPNEPNHPISRFMDELFAVDEAGSFSFDVNNVINSHTQLWNNSNYRKMAMNILLSIGTNLILKNDTGYTGDAEAIVSAEVLASALVIPIIENYNDVGINNFYSRHRNYCVATKLRELLSGSSSLMRDVLKLYSKRITCSCLKEMHSNARKTCPKMGKCFHCHVEKERVLLSVCSRCKVSEYCCRECQVAAWPAHQKDCDVFVTHGALIAKLFCGEKAMLISL